MEAPWYATWFNTVHYHDLYQHRDLNEARGFIQDLCRELGVQPGQKALDMACGRGRHAKVLSEQGLKTVGIDLSPESIEFARQWENEQLTFQVGDMLQPFEVEPVDWVFNLFTSFGYFENDEMHALAIRNMTGALKPGGKLVLDYFNSAKITDQLVPEDVVKTELATYYITRRIEQGTIVKTIRFTEDCEVHFFEERVRAFTHEDLIRFMEAAGLEVLGIRGDYHLGPYRPEHSDRMVVLAQKPSAL